MKNTNNISNAVIIFSGYNQRAVVAFIRTLEKDKLNYAIVASSKDDPIFLTKYKKNVYAIRKNKALVTSDILSSMRTVSNKLKADKFIIAPSTEGLNRFLLKNRNKFEEIGIEIPLVDEKLYEIISDKYKFNDLCIDNGIVVPKEYKDINDAKRPYVAKPKNYFDSGGSVHAPILIFTEEDEENFKKDFNLKEFYYQEFVDGKSFYLLYYFGKNRDVYKFSQKNYVQQPSGKSIVAAESSDLHKKNISKRFESLFKSVGFNGLVMVELKEYKKRYYMIEANPRFWGPSQLFIDANVNLFEQFLFDWNVMKKKPHFSANSRKIRYFWLGGFVDVLNKKEKLAYHDLTQKSFYKDISKWISWDIYNRDDTRKIFIQETKNYKI